MAKRKKPIGRTWTRRKRKINGKNRYVWVRRNENGDYETRMHKPEVHGIALAKHIHGQRKKRSKSMDTGRSHKKKIKPTDKALRSYKKRPGSADIKGIDTKRRRK